MGILRGTGLFEAYLFQAMSFSRDGFLPSMVPSDEFFKTGFQALNSSRDGQLIPNATVFSFKRWLYPRGGYFSRNESLRDMFSGDKFFDERVSSKHAFML